MRFRYSQFAIFLPVLFLGACASLPAHFAVPDAARDKISSTEVVLSIQQREIYVLVPNSDAGAVGAGGLLGALVDAGINDIRTSKAETAVKPLRDALVDFDFDKTLRNDVKTSLSQVSWIHGDNVRVIKETNEDILDHALDAAKSDAVMFVLIDYQLSNDCDEFSLTARASLFPISDALKAFNSGSEPVSPRTAIANSLWHNDIIFKVKTPNATGDRDQNIRSWSANNGAAMRATLKLGAEKLAEIIAIDLQRTEDAVDLQRKEDAAGDTDLKAENAIMVDGVQGKIISRDSDGVIVRYKGGPLRYVTNSELLALQAPAK